MPVTTCPTHAVLEAYVLGKLPEADLEATADHAAACPDCQARLSELDRLVDPLLGRLRGPGLADLDTCAHQALTVAVANHAPPPPASQRFPFLLPAQSADEIGRLASFR